MTNTKKKVYQKKPYININIKNENNQQSKNKYVKPPPEEIQNASAYPNINNNVSSQVPLAYEPYNPLASKLWNNPEDAQQLEARGFRNAVRPPPQYEGPNADVPEGNVLGEEPNVEVPEGYRLGGREGVNRLLDNGFIEDDDLFSIEDPSDRSIYSRQTSIYPPSSVFRESSDGFFSPAQSTIYPPSSVFRESSDGFFSVDDGLSSIHPPISVIREENERILDELRAQARINDLDKSLFDNEDYDEDEEEDEEDEEAGARYDDIPTAVVKKRRPYIIPTEKSAARYIEGRVLTPQENREYSMRFRTEFEEEFGRKYQGTPQDKIDLIAYLDQNYINYFSNV